MATNKSNTKVLTFRKIITDKLITTKYKNALYEFKPSYKDYDFIVPSKNIKKTINKMKFSLKKI